ncbi:MAG: nuclear transport factor 2 family protein [Caulobacteraceae bacterium]|nr:nuclear transport factor 2 family protein [Caulobacteraceae bacterium]
MITAEDAIRARRRLTNKFIAAHEAARLRPFMTPDIKVIAGDGSLLVGVEQVLGAFHDQFQDPAFLTYERKTASVSIDADGARAAERGQWVGRWKPTAPTSLLNGDYLAAWRKVHGQWVIDSELYITLGAEDPAEA